MYVYGDKSGKNGIVRNATVYVNSLNRFNDNLHCFICSMIKDSLHLQHHGISDVYCKILKPLTNKG